MKAEGIFKFADYHVDAVSRSVRREGQLVSLNGRAFDVLLYLVQNPGRPLTRDELIKNVWPDTYVDENSLAQSISVLRRGLDEKPGDNTYIVTLPGRGYQFVSPVEAVVPNNLSIVPQVEMNARAGLILQRQTIRTSVITDEEKPGSPAHRSWAVPGLVALLAVSSISVIWFYAGKKLQRKQPQQINSRLAAAPAAIVPTRRSIAVLGFRNLSGRPEQAWLSTALSEMLGTELVAGEKLRLVSGEDVAQTQLEVPIIDADSLSRSTLARLRKDLGSDFVVLGSYTALGAKSEPHIRLDLRLQDTAAGQTIADIAVAGSERDLFDLVAQAGSKLRQTLGVTAVTPAESLSVRASLPANAEAARLYSEGLGRLRLFDTLAARNFLQQSLAADPKFVLAHSALAEAWFRLGYQKNAQREAKQAYELSGNLSREEKLVVEGSYRHVSQEYEKGIAVYNVLFALFPDNAEYGLKLAEEQILARKAHDALTTLSAVRKVAPSEDPRVDLEEAGVWDSLGDFKSEELLLARAEKTSRAQQTRLILARARVCQCWLFAYLAQPQNAVKACQEAREIYVSAGDLQAEAGVLRDWAAAISQTDTAESIRLYRQAQSIFEKLGSERELATVLNDLGLVFEVQGSVSAAKEMHRAALGAFRAADDKRGEAVAVANIGDEEIDQGDLTKARLQYNKALRLNEEAADTSGINQAKYNLAVVDDLQGNLGSAKEGFSQSLSQWKTIGHNDAAASTMSRLGGLLLEQADFSGSRQMYEQALAIRRASGEELLVAQIQLGLAELALEERKPSPERETDIRHDLQVFQTQKVRDDEVKAWCLLARSLARDGKISEAQEAVGRARPLANKSENPRIRWQAAIAAAQIEAADGHPNPSAATASRRELRDIIAKSAAKSYVGVELEARLSLAELEMKLGRENSGHVDLASVEEDANSKGFILIARNAAEMRVVQTPTR
jgi:DNA-binding winged helix-turn-helix (wHTH) protein/TolB-like protein